MGNPWRLKEISSDFSLYISGHTVRKIPLLNKLLFLYQLRRRAPRKLPKKPDPVEKPAPAPLPLPAQLFPLGGSKEPNTAGGGRAETNNQKAVGGGGPTEPNNQKNAAGGGRSIKDILALKAKLIKTDRAIMTAKKGNLEIDDLCNHSLSSRRK